MKESLEPKPNNPTERKERPKRRILFADDDESMRQMVPHFFKSSDYEIVAVSDGQELIDEYSKGGFDIVVADNNMPKVNGIDALEQIKKENSNLPVILLTGLLTDDVLARVEKLNNSRYFEKPVSFDKVAEITKEMIEKFSTDKITETPEEMTEKPSTI